MTTLVEVSESMAKIETATSKVRVLSPYEQLKEKGRISKYEIEDTVKKASITSQLRSPAETLMEAKANSKSSEHIEESKGALDPKANTYQNGTTIPQFKPAIFHLNEDGTPVETEAAESVSTPKVDNSAVIKKYPELAAIQELIYSKGMDLRFIETSIIDYIGVDVIENGISNQLISFCVDLTGSYITKDKKLILNAPQIGQIAIQFEQQAILSDYLDKKFFSVNMSDMDMFTTAEKEVNKLVALSTLPAKGVDSRKTIVDTLVSEGFQKVFAAALEADSGAQFRFTSSSYKSVKVFKLTSEVNKKIVISYDAGRENDNVKLTIEPIVA